MLDSIGKFIAKFSIEEKKLKKYKKEANIIVDRINNIENNIEKGIFNIENIIDSSYSTNNKLDKIAYLCILSDLKLELKPHFVQIIGILSMIEGNFIEMKTGEGKTLVAGLSSLYLALEDKKIFIVTVNDYLAKRDSEYLKPLANLLNIEVSFINNELDINIKKEAYTSNIIFGTNSTFAFDYLKDNLTFNKFEICQTNLDCVIVDEADSILIDEARTPLIISGPSLFNEDFFIKSFNIAEQLINEEDFKINKENQSVSLTNNGILKIEKLLNISNLYISKYSNYAHQIQQSLKALHALRKDVEYMIIDEEIKIIDEYNGRILKDTRYSNGLHQAIEVKENVPIKEENENLAQITYQSYFNLFSHLCGMSGTLITERKEFKDIYNKLIIEIPTNLPLKRIDHNDKLFINEKDKLNFLLKKVIELNNKGIPILIGTLHIEQSEKISNILTAHNLKHNMLNAKNHMNEAEIIKEAGKKNKITIATNMAGRGVDIKPDKEVLDLGGLFILGFERYQNRRIDNQLIGRSGRQGNPGQSLFLLSLDDEILKFSKDNFLYESLKKEIEEDKDGVSLDLLSKIVSKQQKKLENINFDIRKDMYKYTNVLSVLRNNFYKSRQEILYKEESDIEFFRDKIKKYINDVYNENDLLCEKDDFEKIENFYFIKLKIDKKDNLENKVSEIIFNKIENELLLKYNLKHIFLENMDSHWREFIKISEIKRNGIHHKQMTNKDPLIEYQLDLEKMFNTMITDIKIKILSDIFNYVETEIEEYENTVEDKYIHLSSIIKNTILDFENKFQDFINFVNDLDTFDNLVYEFIYETLILFTKDDNNFSVSAINDFYGLDLKKEDFIKIKTKNDLSYLILTNIKNNINNTVKINNYDYNFYLKNVFIHYIEKNINSFNENINIYINNNIDNNVIVKNIEENFIHTHLNIKIDVLRELSYVFEENTEKDI